VWTPHRDYSRFTLPFFFALKLMEENQMRIKRSPFKPRAKAGLYKIKDADPTYDCECIDCGHEMQSDEHCRDIKCPECGGDVLWLRHSHRGSGKFRRPFTKSGFRRPPPVIRSKCFKHKAEFATRPVCCWHPFEHYLPDMTA